MAPRRGGAGAAGAEVAVSGSGRNYFEPPPLKRMMPWQQDGSGQCDIIAGGVDESGIFKGVYVSGVHMCALMRTFQLSKVFMPVDMPAPVAALGQSLQDGIPLVVVTRGCFGRELDYGPGPVRNDTQKSVWNTCRELRAEMPQVLISCIDIPANLGSDMIQACLEPPLNEYRELMYQDGTWYTPTMVSGESLAKFAAENPRPTHAKKAGGAQFNRKKFGWTNTQTLYGNIFVMTWKTVLEVRQPADVPRRQDLKFVDKEKVEAKPIKDKTGSAAEATLTKAVAKAAGSPQELVSAVKAYLPRAKAGEAVGLAEVTKACQEASDAYKGKGDAVSAFGAMMLTVEANLTMTEFEAAMKVATELKASAANAKLSAAAVKLVVDCHNAVGDLDKALEAAVSGKADVAKKNDDDALVEALQTVVSVYLAKGEFDEAVKAATEATKVKSKKGEAAGNTLLGSTLKAKAVQGEDLEAFKKGVKDAVAAQKKAATLYKDLGDAQEQAEALKAVIHSLFLSDENSEAAKVAKEMQTFTGASKATGLQLLAAAHILQFAVDKKYLDGGEAEMRSSAKDALDIFEQLGDAKSITAAQQVLTTASSIAELGQEDAQVVAGAYAASFKATGATSAKLSSLIASAQTNLRMGKMHSAYWDAKKIMLEAEAVGDGQSHDVALGIMSEVTRRSEEQGKPMQVGGPVPMVVGAEGDQYITYV